MAKNADLDTTEVDVQTSKKSKKMWCERISCTVEGVCKICLCVSRIPSEHIYLTEREKNGIKSHLQILQGHVAPHQKSRKKGSITRSYPKSVNLMSVVRALPDFRKEHMTKPYNKEDAPGE